MRPSRIAIALFIMGVCVFPLFGQSKVPMVTYLNKRWGFCVSYPEDWSKQEGLNMAGIRISRPSVQPAAFISFGALPDQPRGLITGDIGDDVPMTLAENSQAYLQQSRVLEAVEVLENRPTHLLGNQAISTLIKYSQHDGTWMEKTIWLLRAGALYTFSLKSKSAEFPHIEPVFHNMVNIFKFDCARPSRK